MYGYLIVLCLVLSEDVMIVDWMCLLYDVLLKIFNWIMNGVCDVNCVVFDVMLKLLGMIEWE